MKKTIFLIFWILTISLVVGCVATPAGPSVSSLGSGSDTAYLNAGRGRADAQITKAQADQYALQQEMVAREQALEQSKRSNTINNANGILQGIQVIRNLIPY